MKVFKNISLLFLIPIFGIFSCSNEPSNNNTEETAISLPENVAEMVLGKWELKEGFRNGTKTETLADTYFSFTPEGKMQTNLGGGNELVNYTIEGRTIKHESQKFPADYAIEEIEDNSMTISMTMRDIPFKFILERSVVETEEVQ